MFTFLKYPQDKLGLLWQIYRHKLVHLSQPKIAMLYKSQVLAWCHNENIPEKHLEIILDPHTVHIPSGDRIKIAKVRCDGSYVVSIWKLRDDIKDSVTRPSDGYLTKLEHQPDLRHNFVEAVNQIYDPGVSK